MAKDKKCEDELNQIYEELEHGATKTTWKEKVLIGGLFVVLSGVLLFAGIKVVDYFRPKPIEAPLDIVPKETAQPVQPSDIPEGVQAVG